jgi:hypothetical protein
MLETKTVTNSESFRELTALPAYAARDNMTTDYRPRTCLWKGRSLDFIQGTGFLDALAALGTFFTKTEASAS